MSLSNSTEDICNQFDLLMKHHGKTKEILQKFGNLAKKIQTNFSGDEESNEMVLFFSSILARLSQLNSNLKSVKQIHSEINTKQKCISGNNDLLKKILEEAGIVDVFTNKTMQMTAQPDYSIYKDGYVGECFVSHITDECSGICYILDTKRMPIPSIFYANKLKPLNRIPVLGEMFAHNFLQKFMVRAMRCDDCDTNTIGLQYRATLIDIGCKITINDTRCGQFEIDDTIKKIPGCAIKCQVMKMSPNLDLLNLLHTKVCFKILSSSNNLVHIELYPEDMNPFLNVAKVGQDNEFYSYFLYDRHEVATTNHIDTTDFNSSCNSKNSINKHEIYNKTMNSTNICNGNSQANDEYFKGHPIQPTSTMNHQNGLYDDKDYHKEKSANESYENRLSKRQQNNNYKLTPIDLDIISNKEKDKETENYFKKLLKSRSEHKFDSLLNPVLDYSSNDSQANTNLNMYTDPNALNWITHEDRMQEFANSLSNDDIYESCANKIDNTAILDESVAVDAYLPPVNETIAILPTFVIDVEQFYANLFYPSTDNLINASELTKIMNNDNNRYNYYTNCDCPPAINELVISSYEGQFYRAKVTNRYDETNFQVFYIDYGNAAKVKLNNIYKWEPRWDHIPAQSFLCHLKNIKKIQEYDFAAIQYLESLILSRMMYAQIIDITKSNGLTVVAINLFDENNVDISGCLCETNLARYR